MLEKNLDMPEAGVGEVRQENRQAAPPGPNLTDANPCVELEAGLFGEQDVQPIGLRFVFQFRRASTNERHFQPPLGTRVPRAGGSSDEVATSVPVGPRY